MNLKHSPFLDWFFSFSRWVRTMRLIRTGGVKGINLMILPNNNLDKHRLLKYQHPYIKNHLEKWLYRKPFWYLCISNPVKLKSRKGTTCVDILKPGIVPWVVYSIDNQNTKVLEWAKWMQTVLWKPPWVVVLYWCFMRWT